VHYLALHKTYERQLQNHNMLMPNVSKWQLIRYEEIIATISAL